MRPNLNLMKATLTGALGGLLFGFDTVVISGAIDALVRLYDLSPQGKGLTVAIGADRHRDRRAGRRRGGAEAGRARDPAHHRRALCRLRRRLRAGMELARPSWSSALSADWASAPRRCWDRSTLPSLRRPSGAAGWWAPSSSTWSSASWWPTPPTTSSACCTWARRSGAGRWAWPRFRPSASWCCSSAFRAARAGRPRRTAIDEALAVLKLMGEPDPEAELADIRAALAAGARHGPRAGLPLEVPLSAFSGHLHRRIQPTGRHQRHPLLPEQHLCRGRLQPDLRRPAGHRHRRHQSRLHHGGHVADRQAGPQDAAADRRGGHGKLPGAVWHGSSPPTPIPSALVWLLVTYIAFFALSQGAVIWVYIGEVFPNAVRSKGQGVGNASHWFMNAVIALEFPVVVHSMGTQRRHLPSLPS